MEEKVFISFSSCSMPRRGLSRSSRHLKPIPLAKDLHQVMKSKKIGTWGASDTAKHRVKHHPFRHCRSRFFTVTMTFNAHCTVHCIGRFQCKFCESRGKVGTIPYHTVCMLSRVGAQRPGSWNCEWGRSAFHSKVV